MANKPKGPAKRRQPTRTNEKPLSLYPLSFEEAVEKLLSAKPEPSRTKRPQKKGPPDNPS